MPTGPIRHILILTDRDWTHPQAGGTGANLYGQVAHWLRWGHRVTVISSAYRGAARVESPHPGLVLHHVGTRLTVFARAALLVKRGTIRDVDVALEVVNGIAFFTPLWRLGVPRVALVYHVHRDMYVEELGRTGAVAAWLLEALPLRHLYRQTPFVTISESARDGLVALGVPRERIRVVYCGVESGAFHRGERAQEPTLLYLGRLKRYKRLELLLDVVEALPGVRLEIAGDGDHRAALEAEIAARGLGDRVRLHGFVDETAKRELYASAWMTLTASSAEGWCLTVMEAAACGTPSAALRVGGLAESIVDGETGVLAGDPAELIERVRELLADETRREAMGAAAEARARTFTWERTATEGLAELERAREAWHGVARTLVETGAAIAGVAAGGVSLLTTATPAEPLRPARAQGLARVRELWRLFRNERDDPEPFYTWLADELAADLDRRHGPLAGQHLLDLGCGPGYYTAALRARGATVVPVDDSAAELGADPPAGVLLADAAALPVEDASVDGVVCSNLLEHAADHRGVIREIERVLRPGGWAYVSWTNWYSPHGGHDMSPYHLLGPERGPRLYERLHGPPRKNRYGEGLFAVHVGPTLRYLRGRPGLEVTGVEPRYWPRLAFLARVPGLREVALWNCVIRVTRRP
jgi:glycosyltransferase involved in cell wall biosynthesis/SAM-dependent methyltransferase